MFWAQNYFCVLFCSVFCRTEQNTTVLEHVFCVLSSLTNIVNGIQEIDKNSKIPVSKKFTKIFQSKNGKTYSMDTKINEEGSKTFSTLASADLFRKIIQNDFVCHEVCDFKLLKWGVSSRSSALYCPMPRWPCRLRTKWPSGRLTPWSCNFFM